VEGLPPPPIIGVEPFTVGTKRIPPFTARAVGVPAGTQLTERISPAETEKELVVSLLEVFVSVMAQVRDWSVPPFLTVSVYEVPAPGERFERTYNLSIVPAQGITTLREASVALQVNPVLSPT